MLGDADTRDENGVDLTLLETLAAMTPAERLRLNDATIASIIELRTAFARCEDASDELDSADDSAR